VDENFEEIIRLAKKNRQWRLYLQLLWSVVILVLFVAGVGYLLATDMQVVFEGPEAEFEIKKRSGSGFFLGSTHFLLFGDLALLEVEAAGYKTEPVQVSASAKGNTIEVSLVLLKRNVEITSNPRPVHPVWKIDGSFYSSEAIANLELKPGDYTLNLQAANLQDFESRITVPFGLDAKHTIALAPQPVLGRYQIVTQPAGARVFVNQKPVGVSPVSGTLPAEDVTIAIDMAGFQPVADKLSAEELAVGVTRNYVLSEGRRTVALSLKPAGGQLYLNDTKIPARSKIEVAAQNVSKLTYTKEGYSSKSVELQPSMDSLTISLVPTYANLIVASDPSAQVTIDGEDYGSTPIKVELNTGRHTVELQKPGYKPVNQSVKLITGEVVKVDKTLMSLSDSYKSNSRTTDTNSIGIELIRVQPRAFTMGAPRSEVGQRANEIQRRVTFDRSIYMSKYEITEAQYARSLGKTTTSNKPVTSVSWEEAARFCNWLSSQEGLPPFYTLQSGNVVGYDSGSRGYRLPSEAEWEYIAKFHNKPKPTVFVWGNDYKVTESVGNIADRSAEGKVKKFVVDYDDGSDDIANVGSYNAEKSGFHDLSGNVSEWVHDAYILVPGGSREYRNYLGEGSSSQHVVKGSNYLSVSWQELRASFRETASNGRKDIGFRVARYIH
jgi:formylglycine-generating enzyme required for sulfatase activity